ALHRVDDALVHPALHAFDRVGGAARLERTSVAGRQVAIVVDLVSAIGPGDPLREVVSGRAGIVILRGVVDKVLAGAETALGVAGGHGLGHARQHTGPLAGQHLVAVEVAPVG